MFLENCVKAIKGIESTFGLCLKKDEELVHHVNVPGDASTVHFSFNLFLENMGL